MFKKRQKNIFKEDSKGIIKYLILISILALAASLSIPQIRHSIANSLTHSFKNVNIGIGDEGENLNEERSSYNTKPDKVNDW